MWIYQQNRDSRRRFAWSMYSYRARVKPGTLQGSGKAQLLTTRAILETWKGGFDICTHLGPETNLMKRRRTLHALWNHLTKIFRSRGGGSKYCQILWAILGCQPLVIRLVHGYFIVNQWYFQGQPFQRLVMPAIRRTESSDRTIEHSHRRGWLSVNVSFVTILLKYDCCLPDHPIGIFTVGNNLSAVCVFYLENVEGRQHRSHRQPNLNIQNTFRCTRSSSRTKINRHTVTEPMWRPGQIL